MVPQRRIEQVMRTEQCDYSTACSILAKRGAAKRRSKKNKAERERREEEARRRYQAQLEAMKLD